MESDFTLIRSYNNEIDAKMAAQILEENGVKIMLHKDDSGSMRPHLQRVLGVQLFVKKEDFEKAEKVISKFDNTVQ